MTDDLLKVVCKGAKTSRDHDDDSYSVLITHPGFLRKPRPETSPFFLPFLSAPCVPRSMHCALSVFQKCTLKPQPARSLMDFRATELTVGVSVLGVVIHVLHASEFVKSKRQERSSLRAASQGAYTASSYKHFSTIFPPATATRH
jgi:hypothetical protein